MNTTVKGPFHPKYPIYIGINSFTNLIIKSLFFDGCLIVFDLTLLQEVKALNYECT